MILDYFKLASKNLRSRKLRSWLTMLGIFIGIAAVVSLISLGQGLQNAITEQFQKIGSDKIILESKGVIGPPGSGTASNKLTEKDIEVVKNVKGVDSVASMIFKTAKIEFKDEIKFNFIIGMPSHDSEQVRLLEENQNIEIASGRDLKNSDKYKAIVGINYPLKKVFSKEVGLRDKIIIENQEFEVIGTLKRIGNPFDDSAVIIPSETLKQINNIKDDEVSMAIIQVSDPDKLNEISEDIKKDLRKSRNLKENQEDFQLSTPEQILEAVSTVFFIVTTVLIGIAAISLLVGGIGIMNTMYTAVLERTKEIGIMKAIGAKNSDILLLFLIESGILGLIGGVIGVILGMTLSKSVELIAAQYIGSPLIKASFSLTLILGALAFSVIVGSISGVFPAIQASKLKPVDALRYE